MLKSAETDTNEDIDYSHFTKIKKAEEASGGNDSVRNDDHDKEKAFELKSQSKKKTKGVGKNIKEQDEDDIRKRNEKYKESLQYFEVHRNYKIGQPPRNILTTYLVKVAKSFMMSIGNPEYMIQNYKYVNIATLFIVVFGLIFYVVHSYIFCYLLVQNTLRFILILKN